MPPTFQGYNPDGTMQFVDEQGGGMAIPPSADAVISAQRSLYAAGADPAGAMPGPQALAFAPPPRPSLEDRGATAARPSLVIDTGGQSGPRVGFGGPVWTPLDPSSAQGGVGRSVLDVAASQAAPAPATTGSVLDAAAARSTERAPAGTAYQIAPSAPVIIPTTAPGAGAAAASGALVATPAVGAARGGAPGGEQVSEEEITRRRLMGFYDARIAADMRRRPGRAVVVPEHEQKIDRHMQYQGGTSDAAYAAQLHAAALASQAAKDEAFWREQDRGEALETEAKRQAFEERAREQVSEAMGVIAQNEDAALAEYDAMKLDPERAWTSRTAERKVTGLLGILLSGFGGRGSQNMAMKVLDDEIARDVDAQRFNMQKKKEKLGDFAKQRQNVRASSAEEVASKMADHASALARVRTMAQQFSRESGSDRVKLEADKLDAALAQRQADLLAAHDGQVTKTEAYKVVPKQTLGGGGGPNPKEQERMLLEQHKLAREGEKGSAEVAKTRAEAASLAGKASGKDAPGMVVDGQFYAAHPGISSVRIEKAGDQVGYADSALETLDALRKRGVSPITGGGSTKADVMTLSGAVAQMSGSGVPSESDKKDIEAAVTPGLGQSAAIARLQEKARAVKQQAIRSVGAKPR